MSNRNFAVACGVLTVFGIVAIVAAHQQWQSRSALQDSDELRASLREDANSSSGQKDSIKHRSPITKMPENTSSLPNPGLSPLVPTDHNKSTKKVAAALKNKKHPERVSSYIAPAPFDEKKFRADPNAYLAEVEPGRIYQSAQPGKNVPRIKILSKAFSNVVQGEKVFFKVKVNSGDPVTFHSSEMGEFSNRLSTITVRANEEGVAKAEFLTTPGMQGLVNVLVASPRTSGQAHFYVNVNLTDKQSAKKVSSRVSN